MNEMLGKIAKILLIIGGLNWGLAIFNVNLVTMLSFGVVAVTNVIYALVAISAIIGIMEFFQ